ncbi:MAG: lecithin retinol acyltransferase family protein [Cyclobacteriaceae bacterium]
MEYRRILNSLQPGDVLVRNKSAIGVIDHFGLYVGNGNVIDNHPERGVSQISLSSFLNGRSLEKIQAFTGNWHSRQQVLNRAFALIGRPYHLTRFNCEHFVNEVWGAGRKSKQVENVGVLLFFSLAIWGLSKVK